MGVIRVFDLSRRLSRETPVYPGDPPLQMEPYALLDRDGFNANRLCLGEHLGTHIDSPLHFGGPADVSSIPVENLIAPAILADLNDIKGTVGIRVLEERIGQRALRGYWILARMGKTRAYLDDRVAETLLNRGIIGVGIDRDSPDKPPYQFHTVFLKNGGLILENLILDHVPVEQRGCRLLVVGVPRIVGGSGFPARVFLLEFEGEEKCPDLSINAGMGG